jgi:hypothetical protein
LSPVPFQLSGEGVDLAPRVFVDKTVDGSPATSAEVVIATLSIPGDLGFGLGVLVIGHCSLTVGTDGTSILTRIRRDSLTGTVIFASGATTATAATLVDRSVVAFDTSPTFPGEVYVMTLTVGAASAASTVSAVCLTGIVI